jgi:CheY-like chemotaxis protein
MQISQKLGTLFKRGIDMEVTLNRNQPGAENQQGSEGQIRILVAEDNPVNQKVVLKQLQSLGYQAEVVNNGQEALDRLAEHEYDIVLMDCQMPVMDGYRATQEVRLREGDSKHTTIIAITANAMPEDRDRCLNSGMDDYMSKPASREDLRKKVELWTRGAS